MNKIKYFFLLILLSGFILPSTTIHSIYIKEYNVYFYPDKGCLKSYTIKINDSTTVNINLRSCKGAMSIEVYEKGMLIEKGKYINSLDLLKNYNNRVSFNRKKDKFISEIIVSEYYQPLRDSVWLFYDQDSVIKKIYKRGIEQ